MAHARLDCAPTTAYIMLGERCVGDCAFCAQARSSASRGDLLSRVTWPAFDGDEAAQAIARAADNGALRRICFQVTTGPGHVERTLAALDTMRAASERPICVSIAPRSLDDVSLLLEGGATRVTLSIDAACERVYARVKSGSWRRMESMLLDAARRWPGRIGTHLIVGLGETEQEMVQAIERYLQHDVAVGLFAFTPVPGTRLAELLPPTLSHYRRVQAARWLLVRRLVSAGDLSYDDRGCIISFGLPVERLGTLLADTEDSPFRTSGCADCNRPFYNEKPGGALYNYPRPLTASEASAEVCALLRGLGS